MALNIVMDGYVYNDVGSLAGAVVSYQAFWYPNGTASSPAKWNNVRSSESSSYWNFNLGDSDLLGQEGSALNGGIVLVVFWIGGSNRLADCGVIAEWGAFELSLTGNSFYSNNVQTKSNILPTLNWSNNIPAHPYINTTYNFYNSSADIHSWAFDDITMYHWDTRYGQNIFSINKVASTDYTWGNGELVNDLPGASNSSHTWDSSGNYDIEITITDSCGGVVTDSISKEFYQHVPVLNITRCDALGNSLSNTIETPDTPIYFAYSGSAVDDNIVSVSWVINDTGTYGTTNTNIISSNILEIIAHTEGLGTSWEGSAATVGAFTNPGTHSVTITVIWYDGFQNQTATYTEGFTQKRFDVPPVPNIVCNEAVANNVTEPSTVVTFNYSGTDPENRIIVMDWEIEDTGIYGNTPSVTNDALKTDTITHVNGVGASWCGVAITIGAFTNPGNHAVNVAVTWNDGWDDNIIEYSEVFVQGKFTGPSVNFTQEPSNAKTNQEVSFENTSSAIDRVGLGLPGCDEFTWVWTDGSTIETVSNVPFTYLFNKTPISTECSLELCASWSDGWETQHSCISKDVVFGTVVTITQEDCYYIIDVSGTSTDGTATAYGWTIASGTSSSGVFEEVWASPIAEDQQQKTICFSTAGWFKLEATVYGTGNPTSASDFLNIVEVCQESSVTCVLGIWDGTGVADTGHDWIRTGFGNESANSKHTGTHGLKVKNASSSDALAFNTVNYELEDISIYGFLSFWINIREWEVGNDIKISLRSTLSSSSYYLNLSSYINFDRLALWQRVLISLDHFNITSGADQRLYVNELRFILADDIDFWLDDVTLVVGELVALPVCSPDVLTEGIDDSKLNPIPIPNTTAPFETIIDLSVIEGITSPSTTTFPIDSPFPSPTNI